MATTVVRYLCIKILSMRSDRSNSTGPKRGPKQSENRFVKGPSKTWDNDDSKESTERQFTSKKYRSARSRTAESLVGVNDEIRLNRYLANAGICSRREADDLIQAGLVEVNGKVVVEMGIKVKPSDVVKYNSATIKTDKMRYVVLNKPKGFLASMDDPTAKKTVLELVGNACRERIYPVSQMERGTTGVLLFTNDAETAKKLTTGLNGAINIYHIVLDKPLKKVDMNKIVEGIELDCGKAPVEEIKYIDEKNKREIGLRISVNRNRIVRKLFAHLGYEIEQLDRVSFAGLTKKSLTRGQYRFLEPKEVGFLKTR